MTTRAVRLIVERREDAASLESESALPIESTEAAAEDGRRAWSVALPGDLHPWDAAHRALEDPDFLAPRDALAFAEPDLLEESPFEWRTGRPALESVGPQPPDDDWPAGPGFGWHLDDAFSQLRAAREHVGDRARRVRIAILDTGYDPDHATLPEGLELDQAANFADEDRPGDARDPAIGLESVLRSPGHGTATLALLAGSRVRPTGVPGFDEPLGGAPQARVVPVRISDSVIHIRTSAMMRGIDHAVSVGADVVSISMGGVASRAWARAVNRAYERGTSIFAAAGNNVAGAPTRALVFPARFHRVVAVCGATAERTPYFKGLVHLGMQGNFGPSGRMRSALTAYTPNVTWAEINQAAVVSRDGAGTSSATPQAAAAAALWLAWHGEAAGEGWRRVEAVRHALFQAADRSADDPTHFGRGLLRAREALDVSPDLQRPKAAKDRVWFPWIRLLFRLEMDAEPDARQEMLELEAFQIYQRSRTLQEIADWADPVDDALGEATKRRLLEGLAAHPQASRALRRALRDALAGRP